MESKSFTNKITHEIEMLRELLVRCVRGIEMDILTNNKDKALADKADLLAEILIKGMGR